MARDNTSVWFMLAWLWFVRRRLCFFDHRNLNIRFHGFGGGVPGRRWLGGKDDVELGYLERHEQSLEVHVMMIWCPTAYRRPGEIVAGRFILLI